MKVKLTAVAGSVALALASISVGCSDNVQGPAPVPANDLGIQSIQVQKDENGMFAEGLDKDGKLVVNVKVTVGMIDYVPDTGMDPRPVDGREVVFTDPAGGVSKHQDPFRTAMTVQAPPDPRAEKFAAIPAVASTLKEYGLTFVSREAILAAGVYTAVAPSGVDFSSAAVQQRNTCSTVDTATGGGQYRDTAECSSINGYMTYGVRIYTAPCDSYGSPLGWHVYWTYSLISSSQYTAGNPYPCITYSIDGDPGWNGGCGIDFYEPGGYHWDVPSGGYYSELGKGAAGTTWQSNGTGNCTSCSNGVPQPQGCSYRASGDNPAF